MPLRSSTPPSVDPSREKTPFGIPIPCVGGEKSRRKQRKGRFALCGLSSRNRPTIANRPPRFSAQVRFDRPNAEDVAIGNLNDWMLRQRVGGSSQGCSQRGSCRMGDEQRERASLISGWLIPEVAGAGISRPCSRQQVRIALTHSACKIAGRTHRGCRSFSINHDFGERRNWTCALRNMGNAV